MNEASSTTSTGMTADQVSSTKTALTTAGNGVLSTFIDLLPATASLVAISFAIYFISKQIKKIKHAK